MDCDRYSELLSARLDGALTEEEKRELEEHLAACPDCRAVGAQLSALQGAFPELEEAATAPEGFVQGVMDRIREEASPKVIPLFKRPQVRALAGLAACLMLVVGIYGISQLRNQEKMMLVTRSFQHDVMWKETIDGTGDASACETPDGEADGPQVNASLADPEPADAPQIASYAAPESSACIGAKRAGDLDIDAVDALPMERLSDSAILVLERMPEGAAELIPPETAVTHNVATGEEGYRWLDVQGEPEALARIEQLAQEQEMCTERSSGPAEEALYHLVILQPND